MDTLQLIPLLFVVGLVGLSYHCLTASPFCLALLDGHRDLPGDQAAELSWVTDQFRLAMPVAACHPNQPLRTHIARRVHPLPSVHRVQLWLSWPNTATFYRSQHTMPRHRAARSWVAYSPSPSWVSPKSR